MYKLTRRELTRYLALGGLATSFMLELLVYPAVYYLWKVKSLPEGPSGDYPSAAEARVAGP